MFDCEEILMNLFLKLFSGNRVFAMFAPIRNRGLERLDVEVLALGLFVDVAHVVSKRVTFIVQALDALCESLDIPHPDFSPIQ